MGCVRGSGDSTILFATRAGAYSSAGLGLKFALMLIAAAVVHRSERSALAMARPLGGARCRCMPPGRTVGAGRGPGGSFRRNRLGGPHCDAGLGADGGSRQVNQRPDSGVRWYRTQLALWVPTQIWCDLESLGERDRVTDGRPGSAVIQDASVRTLEGSFEPQKRAEVSSTSELKPLAPLQAVFSKFAQRPALIA